MRQLGFVLAWIIQQRFLPDFTRSGTWTTPPNQEPSNHPRHPDATKYLDALRRGTAGTHSPLPEKTVETAIKELQESTDVIEQDSEEDAEEEDPERDALQERAAKVTIDSACTAPTNSHGNKTASTTLFAPPMPELEFTVIRNLFRGTRHWCVKGKHIICQERLCPSYDRSKYDIAPSHDDPLCLD